ncbi:metabolite traffic protein EboE [Pseudomonas sp. ICBG1301]|uniref:metabolite traffic protein EboE n=1 Tax=Pseudomonas sp. ICBG1301 TaxID=2795987 RepID=UPI00196249FC|nr:metabolite traffic protein EboE [Pseudomonas sp. ICBG1301]MBM9489547.1 metabolite traffic protein EboE [Pseudomonas sp. ICBG1301]
MSDIGGWTATQVGYCSNVHPTRDLAGLRASIAEHFRGVRNLRGLDVQDSGLWICAHAARQLQQPAARQEFLALLQSSGLRLTSLNGFPYGEFHQGAVKAEVYLPSWADPQRLAYSLDLAYLLAQALPPDCRQGVISTVPLGYAATWSTVLQARADEHLSQLTAALAQLHQDSGKKIVFCLEMEPDCVLENTEQAIAFFQRRQAMDPNHAYLALCFDVCHQAVMFEDCYQSLDRLRQAGVPVGKVQLSNAMICRLPPPHDPRREQVLDTLGRFAEATYLHQVKALDPQGRRVAWADLPAALAQCSEFGELRVHFHIPLFSERLLLPELSGSQEALAQTFDYLSDHVEFHPVLEVETYSWGVLPAQLRPTTTLAQLEGIVAELHWVEDQLRQRGLLHAYSREAYADAF